MSSLSLGRKKVYAWLEERRAERRRCVLLLLCAPSSSQTCKVLDCAVAPVVHIIMENRSKAPKAIRMAPEGAPNPQGLALYVITEEIIVSLPALTHRQRGMIKSRGGLSQDVDWTPSSYSDLDQEPLQEEQGIGWRQRDHNNSTATSQTHTHVLMTHIHTDTHTYTMHNTPSLPAAKDITTAGDGLFPQSLPSQRRRRAELSGSRKVPLLAEPM